MSEQSALRRAFAKIGRRHGEPYPMVLKERAIAWSLAERRTGATWEAIGSAIGVHKATVREWCAPREVRMQRVEVVEAEGRTVSIVSPSGYRIEGVTLHEATALFAQLQ